TGKARSRIRSAMKEERRQQGELGRETLERKLKGMKVDFEESVERLVKDFDLDSHADLYYAIATDDISVADIFKTHTVEVHNDGSRHLVEIKVEIKPELPSEGNGLGGRRRNKLTDKPRLLINGEPAERFDYTFATCCNPVQGDAIFAYLTANAGLKIHRSSCPNATNLMAHYGYRVMKAEWVSTTDSTFVVDLILTGIDDGPGVIERLTNKISTMLGLNIRSFSIEGDEGYFKGRISLLVKNRDQLYMAVQALKNLDNISTVTRVE
ncbi:MAG TPA: ACT domain-containing protein, partial [Phaeodactylibacter sp.]|nr:ACT domain-containing protein [Phaeodactylibacter sp.]